MLTKRMAPLNAVARRIVGGSKEGVSAVPTSFALIKRNMLHARRVHTANTNSTTSQKSKIKIPLPSSPDEFKTILERDLKEDSALIPAGARISLTPFKKRTALGPTFGEAYLLTVSRPRKKDHHYAARVLAGHDLTEMNVAKVAGDAGIAPRVHHINRQRQFIISDYVPVSSQAPAAKGKAVLEIADLIQQFSQLKHPEGVTENDSEIFINYHQSASQITYSLVKTGVARFDQLNKALHQDLKQKGHALLHGDCNPGNFLFDGNKHKIIDFEFTRIGPPSAPLLDLATFSLFQGLSLEDEVRILTRITNHLDQKSFTDYLKFKELSALRYFIIFSGRAGNDFTDFSAHDINAIPAFTPSGSFNVQIMNPSQSAICFLKTAEQFSRFREQVENGADVLAPFQTQIDAERGRSTQPK
jgi:hypothetical protein